MNETDFGRNSGLHDGVLLKCSASVLQVANKHTYSTSLGKNWILEVARCLHSVTER